MRSASCDAPISIENTTTGSFSVERDVLADVERERGLAHARPSGDDHEVAGLQSRGHLGRGRRSRSATPVTSEGLSRLYSFSMRSTTPDQQVADLRVLLRCPRAPCSAMCSTLASASSSTCLRAAAERVVGGVGDLAGRRRELAQDRALAHDLRVVADVGGRRHVLHQRAEVREPADVVELLHRRSDSDSVTDIGRLALADEPRRCAGR